MQNNELYIVLQNKVNNAANLILEEILLHLEKNSYNFREEKSITPETYEQFKKIFDIFEVFK